MLKRLKSRKLALDTLTIQQLTTTTLEEVAGGKPNSDVDCIVQTQGSTCSCNSPGCR